MHRWFRSRRTVADILASFHETIAELHEHAECQREDSARHALRAKAEVERAEAATHEADAAETIAARLLSLVSEP